MNIQFQASLIPYQTFGVQAFANQLLICQSITDVQEAISGIDKPTIWLGGGSNVLFIDDYPGTVIINRLKGIQVEGEDERSMLVSAMAGENWHEFVLHTLSLGLGGLENLSLIPGTVGAAPIQNIGAYGVELADTFQHLEAIDLQTGQSKSFDQTACQFGYRDSFFKHAENRGRYLITKTYFQLSKRPLLNTTYGAIEKQLQLMGVSDPDIHDVSRAVIAIRSSKLPDPAILGNAGSFFKNPLIPYSAFESLKAEYPNIPYYAKDGDPNVKIPAGWLIEQCGWKGKRIGNVGCHAQQALVIVNYGGATGLEVWNHAQAVAYSVEEQFGIVLEAEVTPIRTDTY